MLPFKRQALAKTSSSLSSELFRHGARSNGNNVQQLSGRIQRRWLSIQELDKQQGDRERVVILGSGWAGYTLSRELDHTQYQVVVVSPRSYFVFTPLLASTAVGTLEFRNALEPIRSLRRPSEFFQAWADSVDFRSKTLTVEDAVQDPRQGLAPTGDRHEDQSGEQRAQEKSIEKRKGQLIEMGWDKLVIAVGCYTQTFGTPGVKENSFFLKDVGDARKIRNRMLACFELAALPTTSEEMKRALLHFAVVGGGPTGIEFSAELHDIIKEDLARHYPELAEYHKITVYDVAPTVLSMFDEKLTKYATETFQRENIEILTSHHVEELRPGAPEWMKEKGDVKDEASCYTIKLKEQGEVPIGMCVWSTGLMMNPFVQKALSGSFRLPSDDSAQVLEASKEDDAVWKVKKHPKSGGIITDDRLRLVLESQAEGKATLKDVFALGDCAIMEDAMYPATAQVANQKANWLAKRLNRKDLDKQGFNYKDLGVMAYIGNWNAIMQSSGADISGRVAWLLWRGAYLAKSVSWRNRILIATYWFVNWAFGRDISRF